MPYKIGKIYSPTLLFNRRLRKKVLRHSFHTPPPLTSSCHIIVYRYKQMDLKEWKAHKKLLQEKQDARWKLKEERVVQLFKQWMENHYIPKEKQNILPLYKQ